MSVRRVCCRGVVRWYTEIMDLYGPVRHHTTILLATTYSLTTTHTNQHIRTTGTDGHRGGIECFTSCLNPILSGKQTHDRI